MLVVVLNYRTAELAVDCLRSLEAEIAAIGDARVVVVDNASDDGSVELRAYVAHPLPLKSGGLFGKITLQLDCADEKELVLDLLGLIRIGGTKP